MIRKRERLDDAQLANAYADFASAVTGKREAPRFDTTTAQVDEVIGMILESYKIKPREAPGDITDFEERLTYMLRSTGVMRRNVRLDDEWYKTAVGSMLGYLEDGTPVALMPRGVGGYYYVDPTTRARVRLNKKTAPRLRSDAICFYRPLPLRSLTVRDLGRFILSCLRLSDLLLVIAATAAVTYIGLFPARVNKLVFSQVIPSGDVGRLLPVAALLLGISLSQALIAISKSLVLSRTTTRLSIQVEAAVMSRLVSLEVDFFKSFSAGDLASRASRISTLSATIVDSLFSTGLNIVFSVAYVAQIAQYAPSLLMPSIIIFLADMIIITINTVWGMVYSRKRYFASAEVSGVSTTLLGAVQKIKLAGAERRAFARWGRSFATLMKNVYDIPMFLKIAGTLPFLIGLLGTIFIYYFAATAHIATSDYMAFNVAFGLVIGAITSLEFAVYGIASIRPAMEFAGPIINATPEIAEDRRPVTKISGAFELKNVTFSYGEDAPLILNGVSFKVKVGEYIGIVGKTGCGKSTLMRLLLGFERPTHGQIYYDNIDFSKMDLQTFRRNIGVAMQDGQVFNGDIFSNITIGKSTLTQEEAWDIARQVALADDIHKMPMGMSTLISEGGGGISGGQKQQILIARAIAPGPNLLMLDEATSALDNIKQRQVIESLNNMGCTRITIAHRLSTVQHCDRILVMDEGRIAEEGTYDELIAKKGVFADLVSQQLLEN